MSARIEHSFRWMADALAVAASRHRARAIAGFALLMLLSFMFSALLGGVFDISITGFVRFVCAQQQSNFLRIGYHFDKLVAWFWCVIHCSHPLTKTAPWGGVGWGVLFWPLG